MRAGCFRYVVLLAWVGLLSACAVPSSHTQDIKGQEIADTLNARYVDRAYQCAGEPAYVCSGVMLRVFGAGDSPLDPSPDQIARNGVSFSFIRDDLGITALWLEGWVGMAVNMGHEAGFTTLTVRCAWPYDANTNTRPDGCGRSSDDMTPTLKSRPCAQQGIDTPQAWGAHFASLGDDRFKKYLSCGFAPTVDGYNLSIESHAFMPDEADRARWNETLIAAWRQEDVSTFPVEAVFFNPDADSIYPARGFQCKVFFATSRRIPLLRLHLEQADKKIFSFDPTDQIDFDTALPSCGLGEDRTLTTPLGSEKNTGPDGTRQSETHRNVSPSI